VVVVAFDNTRRVMRKRATIYAKFHCKQVAALALDNER
jgi:hypothetical protein